MDGRTDGVSVLSHLFCFQEDQFLADQKEHLDTTLKRIIAENKQEILEMERSCLDKKQHLIRGTRDPNLLQTSVCTVA